MIGLWQKRGRVRAIRLLTLGFIGAAMPRIASADVVVSTAPTQNMSCSGGVCQPTATDAVLNVSDLENLLASGNVTVTTTGSGVQANNIDVKSAFGWATQNQLALNANSSVVIDREVSVAGQGGLSISSGPVFIGEKGRIAFQNLSSQITINGTAYVLVNNIASLASAIASNPSGSYAFADDYDASQDGTYTEAPIQTTLRGTFDGLGNTISHLSIVHTGSRTGIGLFLLVLQPGAVQHVRLTRADITGTKVGEGDEIGILAGGSNGASFFQDSASGRIHLGGARGVAGGLIANFGDSTMNNCSADVIISSRQAKGGAEAGGLVGVSSSSSITESFASGSVSVGKHGHAGGLVGKNYLGLVEDSYSTGAVSGADYAQVGGLIGNNDNYRVQSVYSTGVVSGGSYLGGFAGENGPRLSDVYWDTDTSGTTQPVGKGDGKGITGLTTQQLQSGLPKGFDANIWGEKAGINNGLPYLLANPPPK